MRVELTFTNGGKNAISEERSVYLAIDDDAGLNHLRRKLPSVDFRRLTPGQQLTFSETLLAPAFQAGHYTIQLWIPSADPSLEFDARHNFLLSNPGVADQKSGLNQLATFTAVR